MNISEITSSYDSNIIVRRWAATWLDFIILAVLILAPILIAITLSEDPDEPDVFLMNSASLVSAMILLAYYPILETIYGKTIGKKIAGIVVVGKHGTKPRFIQAIIRTLFRLIEVNPVFMGGLPAGIVAGFFSRSKQRLGDMCAGTYVILESDRKELSQLD